MPPAKEIVILAVWLAAAVNVTAFTFKAFVNTYSPPPLKVYQGN